MHVIIDFVLNEHDIKVCISSIFLNDKQVFFGPNSDLQNFVFDQEKDSFCANDKMKTPWISIQNGIVSSSFCKGLFYGLPLNPSGCFKTVFQE